MFNIKGFGLKKLPQRKGGDGKGQGLRSPRTDVWSPGKCPVRWSSMMRGRGGYRILFD